MNLWKLHGKANEAAYWKMREMNIAAIVRGRCHGRIWLAAKAQSLILCASCLFHMLQLWNTSIARVLTGHKSEQNATSPQAQHVQ